MLGDILICTLVPQPAMVIHWSIAPTEMTRAFDESYPLLFAHLAGQGAEPAGAPFAHWMARSPERVELELGVTVFAPLPETDRIRNGTLPGGPTAIAAHTGHYDGLFEAHQRLIAALAEQGHRAAAPPWEVYVTDPREVPDPARWVTQIHVPLLDADG